MCSIPVRRGFVLFHLCVRIAGIWHVILNYAIDKNEINTKLVYEYKGFILFVY